MPKNSQSKKNTKTDEPEYDGSTPLKREQQELFCQYYLCEAEFNGSEAAIKAKYGKKSARHQASQLLTTHNIQKRLWFLKRERRERIQIDQDYVLGNLQKLVDRCMQTLPVFEKDSDGQWIESGLFQFDSRGAAKGLELLGKHLALFTDKVQFNGTLTVSFSEGLLSIGKQIESNPGLLRLVENKLKD